ncbi:MAG TPA: SRPBCC family protein [Chthoniobacterales bacterium]
METIEQSIEVDAPIQAVYNQWTQFEEFPRFMEGVKEVRQLSDKRLHWRAEIAGKDKEWDAEIYQQTPDQSIAWRSTSGAHNGGEVRFSSAGGDKTRVTLVLTYDPEGVIENVGDALGAVSMRVQGDLNRFKEFIENRGAETGAWRGQISGGSTTGGGTSG